MVNCSISIIIPAYNVADYLIESLNSIASQEESPDEIILIDDGSSDCTLEIAKSYNFSCPFKVVSIPNGGQGNARNLGVSLASSDYIYFFDSDDILIEDFISSIRRHIKARDFPDIVLFSGDSFNDDKYRGNRWINYKRGFSGSFEDRTSLLNKANYHRSLFCSPCLYISKKSLWGKGRLEFDCNYLEDEAIFYPLLFSCSSILVIDNVFFLRRNREGSTMTIPPNFRHVNGALNCMHVTLSLYRSPSLSNRDRWHIRKRLEGYCVSYISLARKAGINISYKEIFRIALETLNSRLALKAILYSMNADKPYIIRSAVRLIRKITKHVQS